MIILLFKTGKFLGLHAAFEQSFYRLKYLRLELLRYRVPCVLFIHQMLVKRDTDCVPDILLGLLEAPLGEIVDAAQSQDIFGLMRLAAQWQ